MTWQYHTQMVWQYRTGSPSRGPLRRYQSRNLHHICLDYFTECAQKTDELVIEARIIDLPILLDSLDRLSIEMRSVVAVYKRIRNRITIKNLNQIK